MEFTRRDFIKKGSLVTAALGLSGVALEVADYFLSSVYAETTIEIAKHQYKKLEESKVQCLICPLNCTLKPGETCFCRTRKNVNGRLICYAYNNPFNISIDPIEKLPLHHFLPGAKTISLAIGGCNLRCIYCQNWKQAQAKPEDLKNLYLTKEECVSKSLNKHIKVVAYTYTEPVAFYEYVRDVSIYAKEKGMKNVVASGGFINPEPLKEWCKTIDAFSIALKGFDNKFYEKVIGCEMKPILSCIETIKSQNVWLEIVTLIVPTMNDDLKKTEEMCKWIKKTCGEKTPVHFGRFVPEYKLKDLPRTPVPTLEKCREVGLNTGLKHVYIFNVSPHEGNNTVCSGCKKEVIKRKGFDIIENSVKNGSCGFCRKKLDGIW